jgi:hypothetical protein
VGSACLTERMCESGRDPPELAEVGRLMPVPSAIAGLEPKVR